ncbi:MAG: NADAR family protein [Deltaproteobacteria bacterium]|nr:NADAR family protein [Deltaproteobacteria bacterium]MBW2446348.1 NADAR family protein [Deltaproteobacteria bacterium]
MAEPIHFFSPDDPYAEFSNFAPFGFEDEGLHWPTVEHYFQAQKFAGPSLASYRERIRTAASAETAKDLGQTRDHPLRPDWNEVKEDVMRHALRRKFARPELLERLIATGERSLVEASPTDRYWGAHGSGENRMGTLLSEIRAELRANPPG